MNKQVLIASQYLYLEEALRGSKQLINVDITTAAVLSDKLSVAAALVDKVDIVELHDGVPTNASSLISTLSKPISLVTLLGQLNELLQRSQERFFFAGVIFLPQSREIAQDDAEQRVALTEKETRIIELLLERQTAGITKEELLQQVWGYQQGVITNTLETHIYRLRQKLQKHGIAWQINVVDNLYALVAANAI